MPAAQFFLCCFVFFSLIFPKPTQADPIMCDPNQKVLLDVNVIVKKDVLKDLQQRGVQKMKLYPATDFFWSKDFTLEEETTITLESEGDPLTLALQEGILVTYSSQCGTEDLVYAFCQVDGDNLKGEFPREVNLHLNPALNKCKIEVVCTQCP